MGAGAEGRCVDAVPARRRTDARRMCAVAGRPGIVWLASYPKSGNTWMRALLANCLADAGRAVPLNALPFPVSVYGLVFDEAAGLAVEDFTGDEIESLLPAYLRFDLRRLVAKQGARSHVYRKVHSAYVRNRSGQPLFPEDATAGAVYIVRNPLDVAVSWAFHGEEGDCAKSVARLNDARATVGGRGRDQPRQRLLDWSGNVESWCAAPFPVCVVRYEDMLADAVAELRRVVRFLRIEDVSEARLRRAAAHAGFANLRQSEAREGFREKPSKNPGFFFREGRAGGWRQHLSAVQARDLASMHWVTMEAFGYDPGHALGDRDGWSGSR